VIVQRKEEHLLKFEPTEIDMTGVFDEARQIEYLGPAKKQSDGTWHVLANYRGMLVIAEVNVTLPPSVIRTKCDAGS